MGPGGQDIKSFLSRNVGRTSVKGERVSFIHKLGHMEKWQCIDFVS